MNSLSIIIAAQLINKHNLLTTVIHLLSSEIKCLSSELTINERQTMQAIVVGIGRTIQFIVVGIDPLFTNLYKSDDGSSSDISYTVNNNRTTHNLRNTHYSVFVY